MLTMKKGKSLSVCLLLGAFVLVLAAGSATAQVIPFKVNECSSTVAINAPANGMPGDILMVMLTHTVTESRDNGGGLINQRLDQIDFVPDCTTLGMGGGCATAGMGTATVNLVTVAGSCNGGAIGATDNMDGTYSFNFGMPSTALLMEGTSCNVTFNIDVSAMAVAPATLTMVSSTAAVCLNPLDPTNTLFTAGDQNSFNVMLTPGVPTVGEVGLAFLTLLLVGGGLFILRRREAAGSAIA